MTPLAATLEPEWLLLREPADHRARSVDLVGRLLPLLPTRDLVVHDLGSGTGSMTRWLAPLLPGPQHWVLHDVDGGLLAHASARTAGQPAEGSAISVSTSHGDATWIDAADLDRATLVTASALLDLLTGDELGRITHACVSSGTPALFTLTVTGEVRLTPRHPLDESIANAFNAHQRRIVEGRRLLGPDALAHATAAFRRAGAEVFVADTPWQLGADSVGLAVEWLSGWVAAACEQEPEISVPARTYLRQRLADAAAGRLHVSVGHADLLAIPAPARSNRARSGHV